MTPTMGQTTEVPTQPNPRSEDRFWAVVWEASKCLQLRPVEAGAALCYLAGREESTEEA